MTRMTFFEAALKILQEADGGPLHYKEITKRAIAVGYITPTGRTPEASVGAQLYVHIKRIEAIGKEPMIRQIGKGLFTLSKKVKIGPMKIIEENNAIVRSDLYSRLKKLHPRGFENLIGVLLSSIGFEDVIVLKYSGDGGIDVEAELTVGGVTNVRTAVQVKRWKNNVSGKTVRELRGGLMTDQRGLIITTSSYTKAAIKEAAAEGKTPISLIDGEKLLDLLIQNEIGISKKSIPYLELDLEKLDEFGEEGEISSTGQSLALWPLPGGGKNLISSMLMILRYIAQTEPERSQIVDWMITTFSKVNSEKTIDGYIQVLRTLGLITFDGEIIQVTDVGSDVLSKDPRDIILHQLCINIAGIEQYLEELKNRSMTFNESHEFFKRELSVDWETGYQTKMRILWLENVGAIGKEGNMYLLNQVFTLSKDDKTMIND